MYANASFDEMGGDGLYPETSNGPDEFFQSMVKGGFMKDPEQVQCPVVPKVKVPVKEKKGPNGETRYLFDLTKVKNSCHYAAPNTALSNEDEDPEIPLSGDRWDGYHGGRNILLTTGKVEYFRRGKQDAKLSLYEKRLIGIEMGPKRSPAKVWLGGWTWPALFWFVVAIAGVVAVVFRWGRDKGGTETGPGTDTQQTM